MNWGYGNYYNGAGMVNGWQGFVLLFIFLDLILKGFALWRSARKDQNIWFIALLLVNSLGILPLIYLVLNRDKKRDPKAE